MDRVADVADGVNGTARVAVIGGGYAGMAAAAELASHGIRVGVFEAARVLGGRARRVESDGRQLDNGLHILLGAYKETLRLIGLVKQPGESFGLLRRPLALIIHPDFRLRAPRLPAPLHLLFALLGARGLAVGDRIAAARFMAWARFTGFKLPADMTVTQLLKRKNQPAGVSRFLWVPLCVSALNTPPEEASAQVFLNVLRDSLNGSRADSDLLLPAMDFSALLPERAARFVKSRGGEVDLGVTIEGIRRDEDRFVLAGDESFTHVIIATSPHRVGALLADFPELATLAGVVESLRYQPIYSVYLQYANNARLPFAMGGLEARYSQWVFDRGQLCGQHGLIGVVISASGAHQDLPRDELARAVHAELVAQFPSLGEPLWHQVIAEKRATFACTPGLARPGNTTPVPRLLLAGDYTASDYPATIESAVRSGVRAASLVMKDD
ncbi:MAG TPA: hydroxysqualene dehydroxylase HpnE [Burkholderiales bacterium]|nr:hydroxysqualene dehydroxylase HpnE [Burkholderiales bacterium]